MFFFLLTNGPDLLISIKHSRVALERSPPVTWTKHEKHGIERYEKYHDPRKEGTMKNMMYSNKLFLQRYFLLFCFLCHVTQQGCKASSPGK